MIREWIQAEMDVRQRYMATQKPHQETHYICPADFILREGVVYEPTVYDSGRWGKRGEIRRCYANAFNLAVKHWGQLRYVEGHACGIVPVFHAWCVDNDGNVVDPTWTGEHFRPKPVEYMGVAFPTGFVADAFDSLGYMGSLIDDWQHDYPLLHQPLSELLSESEMVGRTT